MSVPKSRRGDSKYNFFNEGKEIAIKIIKFLEKDFGIKRVNRDLTAFTYNARMDEDDKDEFIDLCEKYGINVEASYPEWLLEQFRIRIMNSCLDMVDAITDAYTMSNPNSLAEAEIRRKHQHRAICICERLINLLDICIRVFNYKKIDIEKYMPFVEMVKSESSNLKQWKRRCNSQFEAIKTRELIKDVNFLNKMDQTVDKLVMSKLADAYEEGKTVEELGKEFSEARKKAEEENIKKKEAKFAKVENIERKSTAVSKNEIEVAITDPKVNFAYEKLNFKKVNNVANNTNIKETHLASMDVNVRAAAIDKYYGNYLNACTTEEERSMNYNLLLRAPFEKYVLLGDDAPVLGRKVDPSEVRQPQQIGLSA